MATPIDRQLLFGTLARQLGFVSAAALRDAVQAWVPARETPLADVLQARAGLTDDARRLLEALVEEQIRRRENGSWSEMNGAGELFTATSIAEPADPEDAAVSTGPIITADGAPVRYHVLREHAKGGLGQVFVARDGELHRQVALKEIQEQFAHDSQRRARFVLEAEITGSLEHPGIVPVYGLGVYSDGRPFYAMRLIRGENLRDAIRRYHEKYGSHRLSPVPNVEFQKLLSRFVLVCNAVAYAHSRGVLHRDIKPSNIMLGEYGETLLVDWGIAKVIGRGAATETPVAETTLRPEADSAVADTVTGSAIGTPEFMSPEAAAGRIESLSFASDVYSLGATLYMVLTGTTPFDRDGGTGAVLERVQRGDFRLPRRVRSDVPRALEAICLKAMALDQHGRYSSAQALAADVERWLAGAVVTAYRESLPERALRWARRRRALVVSAGAGLVACTVVLLVALVLILREKQKTGRERDRADENLRHAERQRDRADANFKLARQAVEQSITHVAGDPKLAKAGFHKLRGDLLASALPFYEQFAYQKSDDLDLEADRATALGKLGFIRHQLGENDKALEAFAEARVIFARLVEERPQVPQYRTDLAACHNDAGLVESNLSRAETLIVDGMRIQQGLADDFPDEPEYVRKLAGSYENLATMYNSQGRWRDVEKALLEGLQIRRKLVEQFPDKWIYRRDLSASHNNLSVFLEKRGRFAEAEEANRESLRLRRELAKEKPGDPRISQLVAQSAFNLAGLLGNLDKPKEAEAFFKQAIELQQQLVAQYASVPEHRRQLAAQRTTYSSFLREWNRFQEALVEAKAALELSRQLVADYPDDLSYHEYLAHSLNNAAIVHSTLEQQKEAHEMFREALAERQLLARKFPKMLEYRVDVASARNNLGLSFVNLGKLDEGRSEYRAAIEVQEELVKEHDGVPAYKISLAKSCYNLGNVISMKGDPAGALDWQNRAISILQPLHAAAPRVVEFRLNLIRALDSRARVYDLLKRYAESIADWDRAVELSDDFLKAEVRMSRALTLVHAGKTDAAVSEADALVKSKVTGDVLLISACVYAQASAIHKGDTARHNELAAKAIGQLRRLQKGGFFKLPDNLKTLKTDNELKPIRQHPDFQKLLQLVEKSVPPKKTDPG